MLITNISFLFTIRMLFAGRHICTCILNTPSVVSTTFPILKTLLPYTMIFLANKSLRTTSTAATPSGLATSIIKTFPLFAIEGGIAVTRLRNSVNIFVVERQLSCYCYFLLYIKLFPLNNTLYLMAFERITNPI